MATTTGTSSTPLADAPDRNYADKLSRFEAFAMPELGQLLDTIGVRAGECACDLGCGTGGVAALLAQRVGSSGAVLALDLSKPHCRETRIRHPEAHVVVADVAQAPLRPRRFDLLWLANTVNHLADPVHSLTSLRSALRDGGRLVIGQSSLLPDMVVAWDMHLERTVTEACHRYYREKYGLDPSATAGVRRLVGLARDAGLAVQRVQSIAIERFTPLAPAARDYIHHVILHGYWGAKLRPYLAPADWDALEPLLDPASPAYCLNRPDFHFVQLFSVVV